MSTLASVILYDVAASRPAAGIDGRLFFASDTGAQSRDNGATWDDITPSGGGGAAGGVNAQTADYTAVGGDSGKLVSMNNASARTITLPASPPSVSWWIATECVGAGGITIARNGLNIDGAAANVTILQGQGCLIYTDGSNYFTSRGSNPLASSTVFGVVKVDGTSITATAGVISAVGGGGGAVSVVGSAVFNGTGGISSATYKGVISSVTRSSTGIYVVNFSTLAAGYTVSIFAGSDNSQPTAWYLNGASGVGNLGATSFEFAVVNISGSPNVRDSGCICVNIFS